MNLHSFVLALVVGAQFLQFPAHALSGNDPRTPINAVETPGDADSVFRISQPGSYYLEANLDGVAGKSGIEVDASNVTIDLMGFHLRGDDGTLSAIRVGDFRSTVSIVNGTMASWDAFGVEATNVQHVRVSALRIFACVAGGISARDEAYIERCNILVASGPGIVVGTRSTVSRCAVYDASDGILAERLALVEDCNVETVKGKGIEVGGDSTIRGCAVRHCLGGGFVLAGGSSVISSKASRSLAGIFSLGRLQVIDCMLDENFSDGVRIGSGQVRGCSITRNIHHGIEVSEPAHITGNFIESNGLDGIHSEAGSRIEDNDIRSHSGGAGIRTQGTGSYIIKNTLTSNASVIVAPNAGNFVGTLVSPNAVNGRNDPWANLYSN